MVAKGGSRKTFSISYLSHFMVAKGSSRHPLPFSYFSFDDNNMMLEADPFLPPFLTKLL
jgi:hypothetical protein